MKATDWFYGTSEWKKCRDSFTRYKGGLCERCYAKGLIAPGEVVHHKEYLTPLNMHNPDVTLNWDNLELLCRNCHEEEHRKRSRRFKVDALGRVSPPGRIKK